MQISEFVAYSFPQAALIWFHIVLFVLWLGADMGVYVAHFYILKKDLSVEGRLTAASILRQVDFFPRISMALFLVSGVALIAINPLGERFLGWPMLLTLAFTVLWVSSTVYLFRRSGRPPLISDPVGHIVERLDQVAKIAVASCLIGVAVYTIAADEPFGVSSNPKWLGVKVLLYGTAVASAVGMELVLVPFGQAFGELVVSGSTKEVEAQIRRNLLRCRPFVYAIWISVACAALLGVWKPGTTL